jgi:PAS domain-containing protein
MPPLELILARNFLGQLTTPAFLVGEGGVLVYYNGSAGQMLGIPFEEAGPMGPEEWGTRFGPFDPDGNQIPRDELPLTIAVRSERPAHARFLIRSMDGQSHEIEVTAFPIVSTAGMRGAVAIFWPAEDP